MEYIIRKRKKEDANELAYAMAVVWNDTYKGIIDQSFLDNLYEHVTDTANKIISNFDTQPNYYILEINKKIVGWIHYDFDSEKYNNAAEIHSLYILKEFQGQGFGKLLYNFAVKNIQSKNIKNLVIGCLDGNKSNDFYKHLGGQYIKDNLFKDKYKENIYLFKLIN